MMLQAVPRDWRDVARERDPLASIDAEALPIGIRGVCETVNVVELDSALRASLRLTRKQRRTVTCFHCGRRGATLFQPVDGVPGATECTNVAVCEARIRRQMGKV
jgi:hypothetical protein